MKKKLFFAVSVQVFSLMALHAADQDLISRGDFGGGRGGEVHNEGRGGYQDRGRENDGRGYEGRGVQGQGYDHNHPYDNRFNNGGIYGNGGSVDVIAPVPVDPTIIEDDGDGNDDSGNPNNPY